MRQPTPASQRAALWRQRIQQQAQSGQSVAAFCRDHDLAVQTFYGWKSRLNDRKDKQSSIAVSSAGNSPFIDLGSLAPAPACGALEIRLDLGQGVILTIARR